MNPLDIHDEWLSLIEVSGPFLATPVLKRIFSTGLPAVEPRIRQYLRQAYDEWCEARDNDDPRFTELHRAWIHEVLARGLEYDENDSGELLLRGERIPSELRVTLPEHGVTLEPDYALVSGGKSQLLVQTYSAGTDLQAALKLDGWSASPAERMERLCRASGCRLGLVTDGERWMLVDALVGAVSTFASWYARLWGQERLTLQAFLTLLGVRRFFGPDDETLPSMLDESLQHQEEVTDALGEQVRRAVEVLIQALGKEDRERSGALLQGVEPTELYEAGLTIMMRLVFLLSAEERGLLLMGEEAYESSYAISTLRMQLRQDAWEVLERRNDAWSRLLATFRAVYGGIEHEMLRLPALGGSLFDPNRFPFLEGRSKGSDWKIDSARPLPIDNRTVLLLLEAIQQYEGRTLSYRALDVEQIGYVYEGLLDRTVGLTERVTVELAGGKGAKKTLYALEELEAMHQRGGEVLAEALSGADAIKRGGGAIRKDLERSVEALQANRLLTACAGDEGLRDRALPFLNLLRTDPWGYPLIYPEGAFIVTMGSDRRETGTHYTPKSLTEAIVEETLTPIVFTGPAEGTSRKQWVLKSPAEMLDLKVCDPAMGSGAFLVQVCRWLADRLVEAWSKVEGSGKAVSVDGEVLDALDAKEPLPLDAETRTVIARRLIAERCLYGVDLNPLAVELAKLSIWLVTMAKSRPFGFLDHNLRCGDSLLGIHRLEQLTELSMTLGGKGQQRLFGKNIEKAVLAAISGRKTLRELPIRDIRDVEIVTRLNATAHSKIEIPQRIADAFIGEVLVVEGKSSALEKCISSLSIQAGQAIEGDTKALQEIQERAGKALKEDVSGKEIKHKPFHWSLEFPEVFDSAEPGFDAIVGNPPFLGGKKIAAAMGRKYLKYLVAIVGEGVKGSADLVAFFFLRSALVLKPSGVMGLIASNSIAEGGTREVGLEQLKNRGFLICAATSSEVWPGSANVVTSRVHLVKGEWLGERVLNGEKVAYISPYLTSRDNLEPVKISENRGCVHQGSVLLGNGFIVEKDYALKKIKENNQLGLILFPYLSGQDVNRSPTHDSDRWVINFWDWSKEKAENFSPELFSLLERLVVLERSEMKSMGGAVDTFWRHLWYRSELYHWLGYGACFDEHPTDWSASHVSPKRVMVFATGATKYPCFTFVDNIYIYANTLCVIASESYGLFACLSSDIHSVWAWEHGSRMKQDLRYTHGDIFETFPFPVGALDDGNRHLCALGEKFFEFRSKYMVANNVGMTKFYNDFHDPAVISEAMRELRGLQVEINMAVLGGYDFDVCDLEQGFHEVAYLPEGKNIRFTISEAAREELLYRLVMLNKERSELKSASSKGVVGELVKNSKKSEDVIQGSFF
ncbi:MULTISPECIES: Eco57I restriction-modification methylase domain-containing protein [unclassified Pseudomonas]|uniref:Eco57I restriction-modification methylase domain-containing protein n=1 Tax=unclassified Pseudomonas TaxID=196821 RepID=UPI000A9F1281|nr:MULTISPECIES: type IIL restriction-modification enzyme MmeI [unclassified Pseudomonas]MCE1003809.1 hypothetical protein [Pseudomonas sp. NMI1173_11]